MTKNPSRSLLMLLTSMAIFGSVGIFRKFIPLPSATLACFRGASGALLLFMVTKLQKKTIGRSLGLSRILKLGFSGALIGFNWILLFEAYNYTTVATATLCYYMQPIIVILLSPMVFGERITRQKGFCVLIAFVGMVFVSGILESGIPKPGELRGVALGLGAAVLYAAAVIMNKKLPGIDPYEKTIIQLFSAAVVLIPYLLITGPGVDVQWTPGLILLLLIVGFVHTGIAYGLYFGCIDGLKTQTVAIFSYLDPIIALILSSLILRETMGLFGILGAVMILGAAFFSETNLKPNK